jgi:hypothetical protein
MFEKFHITVTGDNKLDFNHLPLPGMATRPTEKQKESLVKPGVRLAMADDDLIVCSNCFADTGLRIDTERIGMDVPGICQNCGAEGCKKLVAG